MNDWFTWNGDRCTNHHMHVLTPPSIIVAKERVEDIEIPGRPGTLTRRQGNNVRDNVNHSCTCIIDDLYTDDGENVVIDIAGWLSGNGEVSFWNRPEGYFKGRIANQISFDKILRNHPHRLFNVEFQCDPFFYLYSGLTEKTISSGSWLRNDGNISSLPLLKVTGSSGTIMFGSGSIVVDDISDLDYIMIDCDAKIAYKGKRGDPNDPFILLNTRISGQWLEIPTGDSTISYTGGIDSLTVTPRWRCV